MSGDETRRPKRANEVARVGRRDEGMYGELRGISRERGEWECLGKVRWGSDVACVRCGEENGTAEEGGVGEDGGSEFVTIDSTVCRPSQIYISPITHCGTLLCRAIGADDRKIDRSSVKNMQTVSASPDYDERNQVRANSAGTGMHIWTLQLIPCTEILPTATDALPSDDKVDPDAAQTANLPSYLQALEAGATPPRDTAQATASNNLVCCDTKPPQSEDAANEANRNINPVVVTASDTAEVMSPEYATHDSTTDVVPQHDGHPRASVSTVSILKPPMTYANPEDAATLPTPHDASPRPHTTTASNDSIPSQNDASDNIECQLILPPSTNLRPNPAPPPISVLKGWFPRDKKPATMFDLAIVSSYRPPSTELSMIVASPGVSADEKGHDLGLQVAPPVYAKRMAEVAEV